VDDRHTRGIHARRKVLLPIARRDRHNALIAMNPEMVEFVIHGASKITPRELEKVVRAIPDLRLEWSQVDPITYPHLAEQLEFLARLVEDFAAGLEKDLPFETAAEAAYALVYFHREIDIIPDFIPDVGYLDDAEVVTTVLQRHEPIFERYARQKQIDLPPDTEI
jgi:uncharacterized membrane protein YkvA (DUF1232 family)